MDLDAIRSRHQPNGNVVDGPLCTCGHVNCEEAQLLALLTQERIGLALRSVGESMTDMDEAEYMDVPGTPESIADSLLAALTQEV